MWDDGRISIIITLTKQRAKKDDVAFEPRAKSSHESYIKERDLRGKGWELRGCKKGWQQR